MALRSLASMAVVLSLVCARAWAQTPPSSSAPANSVRLPAIVVTAKRTKPHVARAKPAPAATANAQQASPPPPPDVTGAPNIAGGVAVAPTMASQITVTGQELDARP